jgi:S-DNA-T family DNA segregation ATPase FtsK/SpoIIIE
VLEPPAAGAPVRTARRAPALVHGYAREAAALVLIATALFTALALLSFRGDPMRAEVSGGDWVGPAGAVAARAAIEAVGISACFVPIELALLAAPLLNGRPSIAGLTRIAGDVVVVFILAALAEVAFPRATAFGAMSIGGAVGELFGEVLRTLFSSVGSYIIGLTIVALILIGRATFSFIDGVKRLEAASVRFAERVQEAGIALVGAWATARAIDKKREAEERKAAEPRIAAPACDDAIIAALTDEEDGERRSLEIAVAMNAGTPLPMFGRREPPAAAVDGPRIVPASPEVAPQRAEAAQQKVADEAVVTPSPVAPVACGPRAPATAPTIVDTSAAQRTVKAAVVRVVPATGEGFRLPRTDALEAAAEDRAPIDEEQLKSMAQLLEKTLSDYGVSGKVEEIHPGPTVTTFEVSPAAGTKVSKVAGLADDLALGLSRKVRIIAPIPGKNRIGFEIPNQHRVPVNLRELVEDRRFQDMKAPLPCVLGRDIIGTPFFADLASMPHVIVAGATGAGKSVGLNVMLVSLLFRKTPSELRLLMIDPKVVELAPFDRIPHMLLPVVTDMKQAANALKWAVDEMERRYQLFANAGTKNITTYNAWVERVQRGDARPPKPPAKVTAVAPDGAEVEVDAAKDGSDAALPEKIPFIVIVVDEFADLMMQQGKDVEASVARLAQKARAAGMHVILATQRPSVDVITGMIKANFPTRIAFRVAQKVDSRTILDEQGAEHLLGRGDMLVKMNGSNETRRVQCPFCSEEEVQRITDFLRLQGEPVYDDAILKPRDEEGAEAEDDDAESDPMYDAAVRIVAETRRCSTSWIQRKLGVGYNRAAKIVEAMEKRGVVGPANGAKDREVLIGPL